MEECVTRRKGITTFLTSIKFLLSLLVVVGFLYRAYLHMFLVPRWMVEEESNYMIVNDLVTTGSPRQLQFRPLLTYYVVYSLWLIFRINPIIICQYINPIVGALTVIPLFLLGRQFLDKKWSLTICLFWTFSEASFYRTVHFGTTEPLAFFFTVFALYFYQRKKYLFLGISLVLSFLSHLLPAFFVVTVIFFHQVFFKEWKQKIIGILIMSVVILFIYSPLNPSQRIRSILSPLTLFSRLTFNNIFLYSFTELFLGAKRFLGMIFLFFFSVIAFVKRTKQNRLVTTILLSAFGFFVFSWMAYSPLVFAPPRLTFYFVIPLSYYSVNGINHIFNIIQLKKFVKHISIIICICIVISSMVISSFNGFETMLWISDSLTKEEYKVLDELQTMGLITTPTEWWCDYPAMIALVARTPKTYLSSMVQNETVIQQQSELLLNTSTALPPIFKFIFLSERIKKNGFFITFTCSRSKLTHKPVKDVWNNCSMWELLYHKPEYGVKVYKRVIKDV